MEIPMGVLVYLPLTDSYPSPQSSALIFSVHIQKLRTFYNIVCIVESLMSQICVISTRWLVTTNAGQQGLWFILVTGVLNTLKQFRGICGLKGRSHFLKIRKL